MADIEKHVESNGLQKFENFVIFQTADGKVNIDVFFKDETLWLTQKLIAKLFEKGRTTITEHLKKIFAEGELDEKVVCRDFRLSTQHVAIAGLLNCEDFVNADEIALGLSPFNPDKASIEAGRLLLQRVDSLTSVFLKVVSLKN